MTSADAPQSDSPPALPRVRPLLFGFNTVGRRWSAGLRAAAAFGVPAVVVVATGHGASALFVMFGAFAVLYGERRPYRVRAWVVLTAGAGLLAAVAAGIGVGSVASGSRPGGLVEVGVLTVIAMVAVYVVDAARLGPPGALFFVLVCSGAMAAAQAGAAGGVILVCTGIGVGASVVASMVGVVADRRKPERTSVEAAIRAVDSYAALRTSGHAAVGARHAASAGLADAWAAVYDAGLPDRTPEPPLVTALLGAHRRFVDVSDPVDSGDSIPAQWIPLATPSLRYRLLRALSFDSHAITTTLRVGVACLLGGAVGVLIGSAHPSWAVITAVIMLNQGPSRLHGRVRGMQRFAGTVAGLAVFACLSQLSLTGYVLIAVVVALQFGIEIFMPRNYAVAVVFVTPVALLAGGASTANAGSTMADRLLETAVGVVISILVLHLVLPNAHRRTFEWTAARVHSAADILLNGLRTQPVDAQAAEPRRDLQFELSGCVRSGIDSANTDPEWTREHWPAHTALVHRGYDLLAACWAVEPGGRLTDRDQWAAAFRSR